MSKAIKMRRSDSRQIQYGCSFWGEREGDRIWEDHTSDSTVFLKFFYCLIYFALICFVLIFKAAWQNMKIIKVSWSMSIYFIILGFSGCLKYFTIKL